ncbi:MAG: TlpA disulfide reductase family protein [Cyclobacteriaceae bacterium]
MKPVILLSAILLLVGCDQSSNRSEASEQRESKTKPTLEDVSLADLKGNPIKISDYKGQVVFLNFWATWCKPCIAEMPSIDRAKKALEGKEVVFLAASDESIEKIERFMGKYEFSFDFIQMKDDFATLAIHSLPTTIIYDRSGKIILNEVGARDWDTTEMIEKLTSL